MAKKKGKAKNLDELMGKLAEEHSKDLDAAFKATDEWSKSEHQNHLYNNVFSPGQNKLYEGVASKLDELFESEDAKVHNKEKELKQATTAGLLKYFGHVQPSLTKALEGMDDDDKFEILASRYDEHVGAGEDVPSIRYIVAQARSKKAKVSDIKKSLGKEMQETYIKGAVQRINNKHFSHHFNKFDNHVVAAYLKPKFEKAGLELEDELGYWGASKGQLAGIRDSVIEKKEVRYFKKKKDKKAA